MHESLVDDHAFDAECLRVNLLQPTGNRKMDNWFKKNFDPSTGMWVHNHPNKRRLEEIAKQIIEFREEDAKMNKVFGPGEQKKIARQILADIDKYCEGKYFDGARWHLGASQIGGECKRAIWYNFRWVFTPTYINVKGENHKGRMGRLFNRGHREEERFVDWLRGIGFTVDEVDPTTGKQFRISDVNGHYGGSCDGKVQFAASYGDMPPMLCEFKTSNEKLFDKLVDDGVKIAKPEHYAQMCSYGSRMNFHFALYMSICKNTDAIHIEIVELDWSVSDAMTAKAASIINSPTPPAKISENSAYFMCKFCDYSGVCHGRVPYEKNCRSCAFAQPVANGEWFCHKFQNNIPRDFVPKGCSEHTEAR